MEQKLGSFNIEPSAQVWEGVEAALHEKRKRRVVAWWWIPVAGLLLLGFGWWMMEGGKAAEQDIANVKTEVETRRGDVVAKKMEEEKTVLVEQRKEDDKLVAATNFSDEVSNKIERNESKKQFASYQQKNKGQVSFQTNRTAAKENKVVAAEDEKEEEKAIAQTESVDIVQQKNTSLVAAEVKVDSLVKKDTASIIGLVQNKIPAANDSSEAIKSLKKIAAKNNKQHWSLVAGAGLSLVRSNSLFSFLSSDEKALDNFGLSTNVGSGLPTATAPGNGISNSKKLPNTGSFFLIGANYQRNLSKHWDANIGLQYRYIQNKQVQDSTGKTVTNKTNWLELPVNIQYTVNPSSSVKFQLFAGGSVAYAFSQKWLVVPATGNLYYDKALNSGFIFNFNAGISMQMKNGYKLTLMGEQSLTPIHKNNNYKYYWRQWGVQMNMPINLSRK